MSSSDEEKERIQEKIEEKNEEKNEEKIEDDNTFDDLKTKKSYSKEEIDEIIHEEIIDSCREMITYLHEYSHDQAIPLGEKITYDSLYNLIVTGK